MTLLHGSLATAGAGVFAGVGQTHLNVCGAFNVLLPKRARVCEGRGLACEVGLHDTSVLLLQRPGAGRWVPRVAAASAVLRRSS